MSGETAPVVAAGPYRLRNVGSGLLLEVHGSARGSGANVQQGSEKEDGAAGAQHWQLSPVHEGAALYHLTNTHSGKRLDVANASTENGANVQQWKANNYGAQEWLIEQHLEAPGTVTLVSFISGLVLEVADGSTADGANVQQGEDTDSPGQWWQLEPVV
ncbi:RICIN domain-containing protein [Streptomyces sp. NPDC005318]|uniref:RICIN domain-containing protein n=1 Tax=unclassified Streptomyces TaxID=2593676 RepID=UPI002E2E315F|nr:RICIN domain-containing protein [Streptomyces sp. NBC_00316]